MFTEDFVKTSLMNTHQVIPLSSMPGKDLSREAEMSIISRWRHDNWICLAIMRRKMIPPMHHLCVWIVWCYNNIYANKLCTNNMFLFFLRSYKSISVHIKNKIIHLDVWTNPRIKNRLTQILQIFFSLTPLASLNRMAECAGSTATSTARCGVLKLEVLFLVSGSKELFLPPE